ncbi:MAG: hypothetical protein HKN47_11240, partial [Pirellulaceae bacterium]|nr:hypothetical protein [Pirellulaceae bacterium]
HHACCDGSGAFALINDLLIAYALEQGDKAGVQANNTAIKPMDVIRLAHRNRFDLTFGRMVRMVPKLAIGLLGVRQFVMRNPTSLSANPPVPLEQSTPSGYPRVIAFRLRSDDANRIQKTARRNNVTPNQLFTSDLFLAIDDWRSAIGLVTDRWIRFSIPINVRTDKDFSMPAANKVSMVFLDRRGDHFRNPSALLHGIRDELQLISRNRLELMFLISLWLARRFRGNAAAAAKTDSCQSTTLLTNVGSPFKRSPFLQNAGKLVVSDLVLEKFEVVAPLRAYTDVAFSIGEYAGDYHITMHWDPRTISSQQAEALMAAYVKRLRNPNYDETSDG